MLEKVNWCELENLLGNFYTFKWIFMSNFVNAPLHDMLIRIKNAYIARKTNIENVQYSKLKDNVLKILKENWFIKDYTIVNKWNKQFLSITLKEVINYIQDIPIVKFYSKPSRKIYKSYKTLHKVAGGLGIGVISTSKWLMTTEQARKEKVWWEFMFEIY